MSKIQSVIVRHGTTPTGVGVVATDDNELTLSSPCCGALFVDRGQSTLEENWSISAWCTGCELEYTQLMFDLDAVLYHRLPLRHANRDKRWLAAALGYPKDQLKVTVE